MKKLYVAAMAAILGVGMASAQTVTVYGTNGSTLATYSMSEVGSIIFTPGEEGGGEEGGGEEGSVDGAYSYTFAVDNDSYYIATIVLPYDDVCDYLDVPSLDETDVDFCLLVDGEWLNDPYTANAPGFWIDGDGEICTWGATGCALYGEYEDGEIVIGNFPGYYSVGDSQTVHFGLAANDEVYDIPVTITCIAAADLSSAEVVKTVELTASQDVDNDYASVAASFDGDAVVAALGVSDLSECTVVTLGEDGYEKGYTANNGYWYNADGSVGSWGGEDCTFFVEWSGEDYFNCGQYPDACSAGDEYTTTIYLWGNGNVVKFELTYTIK